MLSVQTPSEPISHPFIHQFINISSTFTFIHLHFHPSFYQSAHTEALEQLRQHHRVIVQNLSLNEPDSHSHIYPSTFHPPFIHRSDDSTEALEELRQHHRVIIQDLGLQVIGELRDAARGRLAHARVAVVGARTHLASNEWVSGERVGVVKGCG